MRPFVCVFLCDPEIVFFGSSSGDKDQGGNWDKGALNTWILFQFEVPSLSSHTL